MLFLIGCINLRCERSALSDDNTSPHLTTLASVSQLKSLFHDEEIKNVEPVSLRKKKNATHTSSSYSARHLTITNS